MEVGVVSNCSNSRENDLLRQRDWEKLWNDQEFATADPETTDVNDLHLVTTTKPSWITGPVNAKPYEQQTDRGSLFS